MPTNTTSPHHDPHDPRSRLRRALAAAAAALLIGVGALVVASPASAHDELTSSDPAADSAVDALPDRLTLTFSGELATDPSATELEVTDADGASLADGDPVVAGTTVTQALTGAASGVVTVLWKVVSSDGHPVSGEFGFTVTAAPTSTPIPTTTPAESPTAEPTATPTETPVPAADGNSALPWVIGGLLLLAAVGGAVIYLLVSRARRIRAAAALRAGTAPGAGGDASSPSARQSEPPADR